LVGLETATCSLARKNQLLRKLVPKLSARRGSWAVKSV